MSSSTDGATVAAADFDANQMSLANIRRLMQFPVA